MAGAGLSLLGGTKKNDSTTTHSDIAAGTVVVRDGNESALAGLDRTATGFDTDSALSAVDLRKMQERAEVMQLGGQLLFKGVGDLGGYLSQKAETEKAGRPGPTAATAARCCATCSIVTWARLSS